VTGFAAEIPGETDVTDETEETTDETEETTEEAAEDVKTATVYVEKDGGILLTVDEKGNIISAEYVNELEEKISLDYLVSESLIEGMEALLDSEETDGYVIIIDSEDEEYLAELEKLLEEKFGELVNLEPTEEMESAHPLAHRFAMAQELGITPGKMNLLEKLGNGYGDDAEVDYAEWAEKSVKEIMTAVNAERKAARQAVEDDEEEDTEMEVLTQSLQKDAGNGNAGKGNSGNSNGNQPVKASKDNPGRGNKR